MRTFGQSWIQDSSILALAVAMVIPSEVLAQSANTQGDQGGIGEIVVTAQRREQNLQDVGVSVVAISSADLRERNIIDSKDIVKVAAGVLLENGFGGGATNASLSVRGVSQTDLSPNQEGPNSLYFDDVYLSSPGMAAFSMYDLARIEVLRGPQGTLFGRASSGGLANFISNRPSKDWQGYVNFGYGSYNSASAEAAMGGPLSDSVRFRLAGRVETAEGYMFNTAPGGRNGNDNNFVGIRGQLEADLTDRLSARIQVGYDKTPKVRPGGYRAPPSYLVPCVSCASGTQPALLPADVDGNGTGPGLDFFGSRNTGTFQQAAFNDQVSSLTKDRFAPSLYLNYDLGNATLSSISNYTNFRFNFSEDPDGGENDIIHFFYNVRLKQYSQEVKLNGKTGNLNYTLGGFYLRTDLESDQNYDLLGFSGTDFAYNAVNVANQKVRSWALFGQLEYEFTSKLKATVGLRYTQERKTFDSKAYFLEVGNGDGTGSTVFPAPGLLVYDFSPEAVGNDAILDKGLWSGKIQLDYAASDNLLLYASASRGVKAGGFNTNLSGFSDAVFISRTPFRDEYLYAYEGGAKMEFLDRKLRVNAGAFYYDYHNFQGYAFVGLQGVVANYNGSFKGGEIEITAAPASDIDLTLNASYLDTNLKNVPTVYYGTVDREAAVAPKWTVNGSVTKRFEVPIGTIAITWDGNYIDDRYASMDNNPGSLIKGSFIHNARVSLNMPKSGVEVAFFVQNISNTGRQLLSTDLTTAFGNWLQRFGPPRWFGGTFRKTF